MAPYPILALALLGFAVAGRLALAGLARRRGRPLPSGPALATGLVLVALTLVFDNLMIGAGLVAYDPATISGVTIGLAPLEDLSYPIATALLLPALWHLLEEEADD